MSASHIFGPHKLTPSGLCFGTMQFGAGASESDSAAMYDACRQAGINFLIQPMFIPKAVQKKFWEN
jgi:aryl-alcohol dehydrogenase-like predicted oxidoreductase